MVRGTVTSAIVSKYQQGVRCSLLSIAENHVHEADDSRSRSSVLRESDKAFLEGPGHGMERVMNPVARGLNKKLSTYQLTTVQASTPDCRRCNVVYIYKIWNETKNFDGSDNYLYMYFAKSSNYCN